MIDIIIITGFLGSGKTTLLKRILQGQNPQEFALIINELGAVNADEQILCELPAPRALLAGGCLCCEQLDQLAESVRAICEAAEAAADAAQKPAKLRRIIIETTGLANIAPIANTLLRDAFCAARVRLAMVAAVASALEWREHFASSEAIAQLAAASLVLLSKSDLVPASEIQLASAAVRQINPLARLVLSQDLSAAMLFSEPQTPAQLGVCKLPSAAHTAGVRTLVLRFGEVSFERLSVWLAALLHSHGARILRIKGVLATPSGGVAINGVLHHIYPAEHTASAPRSSELALIFTELEPAAICASFEHYCRIELKTSC